MGFTPAVCEAKRADSDGRQFKLDEVSREKVIEMLRYEDSIIHSPQGTAIYRSLASTADGIDEKMAVGSSSIGLRPEYKINGLTLNHFGYSDNEANVREYRKIIYKYYRSATDYDAEIMSSVTYFRENKCLYYTSPELHVGDKLTKVPGVLDIPLTKVTKSGIITLGQIINHARKIKSMKNYYPLELSGGDSKLTERRRVMDNLEAIALTGKPLDPEDEIGQALMRDLGSDRTDVVLKKFDGGVMEGSKMPASKDQDSGRKLVRDFAAAPAPRTVISVPWDLSYHSTTLPPWDVRKRHAFFGPPVVETRVSFKWNISAPDMTPPPWKERDPGDIRRRWIYDPAIQEIMDTSVTTEVRRGAPSLETFQKPINPASSREESDLDSVKVVEQKDSARLMVGNEMPPWQDIDQVNVTDKTSTSAATTNGLLLLCAFSTS